MPRPKRRRVQKHAAVNDRLVRIQSAIERLRRERASVKRDEFLELSRSLRQVERNAADLAVQFTRIAQMQVDIDAIKRVLINAKLME